MTDKTKQANRIPYESVEEEGAVSGWSLPSVESKKSRLAFSAKTDKKNKGRSSRDGEIVEDYKGSVKPKPLTADDLQKLAAEAKKEAFDQGYQEGLAKGLAEGAQKGQKQGHNKAYQETKTLVTDEIKRMGKIASQLFSPMQSQEETLENIVVDMAIHFAQEIIAQEIQSSPQALLGIVHRALAALPTGSKNVSVYLNEADSEVVDKYLPVAQREWRVHVDDTVASGGCRVQTHESLVDYTCEHRLSEYLKHVREQGNVTEEAVAPVEVYERSDNGDMASPEVNTAETDVAESNSEEVKNDAMNTEEIDQPQPGVSEIIEPESKKDTGDHLPPESAAESSASESPRESDS
ncbi:MAG: flagellar assembly protein FliH [Agarilytica sp.]